MFIGLEYNYLKGLTTQLKQTNMMKNGYTIIKLN